jgi:hypothetical protein
MGRSIEVPYVLDREIDRMEKLEFETLDIDVIYVSDELVRLDLRGQFQIKL